MNVIAYLAPEIPALSATFVYEEMLAMERKGFRVIPVSVHRPFSLAIGQEEISNRTIYLYGTGKIQFILQGLLGLFRADYLKALSTCLFSDMRDIGFNKLDSWKLLFHFFVAVRLSKILTANRCEHLHVHFAHVPTQIAMYASAMTGIPFTIMAHANDIFERGLLLKQKSERAKKFLTISEYNKNYLISLGLSPDNIDVVRCGVSFPIIENKKQATDTFTIGTLGRLVEKKGIDVLIKATNELIITGYKIKLLIAGDGSLKDELMEDVNRLSLQAEITFSGSMKHSDVSNWMQSLDTFVLACKMDSNGDQDGIPVVLMEAMSQGVPVVSTRLSGIPELVIDGETGLLAEPDDVDSLTAAIEKLINDDSLGKKVAESAAIHVQDEFGQDVNINRLLEHFNLNHFNNHQGYIGACKDTDE